MDNLPTESNLETALEVAGFLNRIIDLGTKISGSGIGTAIGQRWQRYRLNNLLALKAKYQERCKKQGFDPSDGKPLSMAVGIPLIEKASLQDSEYLQERWANLLEQATNPNNADTPSDFNLDKTYIEILDQFSPFDCEVLEYMAEHGLRYATSEGENSRQLTPKPMDPNAISAAFPDQPVHISVEKLVMLGCAFRELKTPLSVTTGHGYGALQQAIFLTLIGWNLYRASSGDKPSWMKEESR